MRNKIINKKFIIIEISKMIEFNQLPKNHNPRNIQEIKKLTLEVKILVDMKMAKDK